MNEETNKVHWERVYSTKQPHEVSWTQNMPQTSLAFIRDAGLDHSTRIIDVGGGDSRLVDFLLKEGYEHITVLDISEQALQRTKQRLSELADKVNWIVSDITRFQPRTTYDYWHDRATFHFLTTAEQVTAYRNIVRNFVTGYIGIGTFFDEGPLKCSGLEIRQFTEDTLTSVFSNDFDRLKCLRETHVTRFDTQQQFVFCSFEHKAEALK